MSKINKWKSKLKYIFILTGVSLVLHIIWENSQAPLYQSYESFFQHLPICSLGAVGDVVITLTVLILLWMLKSKRVFNLKKYDYITLAIVGFFIAVGIEQNALLNNKWNYTPFMPILPFLKVGLTPVLQMTILLPLSFWVAQKLSGTINKDNS